MKEPILQMIRSASTGPALQQQLHALMKKRWLRVAGIVIAVFLVLLTALPFLINVNSFSKSPFITAKSLEVVEVVVELALAFLAAALMPLIFSTQSNVIRIALSEPLITLLKAPNGAWKISSLSTTGVVIGKAMAHLTGGFQTLGETEVVNLRLVITGADTISPAGELAFKMVANLHGGVAGGVSKVAGATNGQSGIPFAIEETTSNPKFVPEVGGAVAGLAKGELANVAKGQVPGTRESGVSPNSAED